MLKYRKMQERVSLSLVVGIMLVISGCANADHEPAQNLTPLLSGETLTSFDGQQLAIKTWQADDPHAVIIALHGMNDYSHAFDMAGHWWANNGITVYALDQRGFGSLQSGEIGVVEEWPGVSALTNDLHALVEAVQGKHPAQPLYVLGHSMGGAVAMAANAKKPLDIDGMILAAPAIWGGARMPFFYRVSLSLASSFAPGKTLTGQRAKRQSTDNIPILRGMQKDPLVIKATPLRSIEGMVKLMGVANKQSKNQSGDILYIYGCRDEIIPINALARVHDVLVSSDVNVTGKAYTQGWHLLFRDLQAQTVWADISHWIDRQQGSAQEDRKNGNTAARLSKNRAAAFSCSND